MHASGLQLFLPQQTSPPSGRNFVMRWHVPKVNNDFHNKKMKTYACVQWFMHNFCGNNVCLMGKKLFRMPAYMQNMHFFERNRR